MSQEELADAAGLPSSEVVYQLEYAERSGLAWELSRLAAALHIDMHDLLSDKPIEKPVVLWCGDGGRMNEHKPCPLVDCDWSEVVEEWRYRSMSILRLTRITCGCGVSGPWCDTREDAWDAWDSMPRSTPPDTVTCCKCGRTVGFSDAICNDRRGGNDNLIELSLCTKCYFGKEEGE